MQKIRKWEMFELSFEGKTEGNPFTDYEIWGEFTGAEGTKLVRGFYDGEGIYRVRFMPGQEGTYSYRVYGTAIGEEEKKGTFEVTEARKDNHGPVRVANETSFCYEDGTPYHSIGTTCYAWVNQSEELQKQTLETLKNSSFNKIRFCIFPKYYRFNEYEPITYPYVRGVERGQNEERKNKNINFPFPTTREPEDVRDFDLFTFNTEHFQRFDQRIQELAELGIEADIIIFHPYDKWGFTSMSKEANELYLRYLVARFGAYHNVWWSMANEYDLMGWPIEEWGEYGRLVRKEDPYGHLCSVHNCMKFYDYREDWITHCSMQRIDYYRHVEETEQFIAAYGKPVVWDEIVYEGNIDMGWGNISGQEMVRRFWETVLRGGYPGHGETFVHPDDILWWSHGGVLHGESEPRFRFLKKIWDEVPGGQLKRGEGMFDEVVGIPASEEKHMSMEYTTWCSQEIYYYGFGRPSYKYLNLPEEDYKVEVIDTWNMTIQDAGIHHGETKIELPGHEWMAIRITRV